MNIEIKGAMNKYILILLVAFTTLLPSSIYSTHIVGGDMSFKCLGNDFYEVTLTLRRDCVHGAEDAPFDEQAAVGIFDKTGRKLDFLGRLGILYLPFEGQDTIKNNVPECALSGEPVCVHESVYTGQIFLPFRERGYVLTYQRCCRNNTLNNIIDPLEQGATRFVCLSAETLTSCNSGPAFGSFPDIIVCANEELSFDASATDSDGDSLAYKLYTSHVGASLDNPKPQPPWNPPYEERVEFSQGISQDNMLGSGSPLAIDENTGLLTANPSVVGQYLAGILVEEWRDGEKLSETLRDFEFNVRVCQSFPVVDFEVEDNCAGLTANVTNNSTGAESYVWNFNHPGTDPQFISTDPSPGSFTYPEPGVYNIRLEATDSEGRCVLDIIKPVRVFNSQLTSSFTADNGCCVDELTELSLNATSVEPSSDFSIESYLYTIAINGETSFDLEGPSHIFIVRCSDEVVVTLLTTSESQCTASTTETIQIEQDFGSLPGNVCMEEITICMGSTATLGPLNDARTYEWTPEDLVIVTDPLMPVFTPSVTTVYTVIATDANGAKSTGTVTVNVIGTFDLNIMSEEGVECKSPASFTATANRDDLTYEWSTNPDFDPVLTTSNPGNIDLVPGTNRIYVKATSPEGCEEVTLIDVESFVIVTSSFTADNGCCVDELTELSLNATSVEPSSDFSIESYLYTIAINGETSFDLEGPSHIFVVRCSDDVVVTLLTTSESKCTASTTETIQIEQDFGSLPGNVCMEEITICMDSTATLGPLNDARTYEWTPEDLVIVTDPLMPVFTPSVTTVYTVIATDANGAKSTGTVTVNVIGTFGLNISTEDGFECKSPASFTATANRDDLTYEWSTNPDFDPVLTTSNPGNIDLVPGTNRIYVKATSPEGCEEVTLIDVESFVIDFNVIVEDYNACAQDFTTITVENLVESQSLWVEWEASDNIVSDNLNSLTIDVAALGDEETITVNYIARNTDGCEERGSVTVDVMRSISAAITGNFTSCNGEFSLLATSNLPNATFEWSLTSDFNEVIGTDPNILVTLDNSGTIYMRASAGNTCTSEIVFQDLLDGRFTVNFDELPSEICLGDRVTIQGSSDDNTVEIVYGPSDNIVEVLSPTAVVVEVIAGQTAVTIPYTATNSVNCTVSGEVSLDVGTNDSPLILSNVDCSTGTVTFTTDQEDGTVLWDFGDPSSDDNTSTLGSPSHTYASAGTYTVNLSNTSSTCQFEPVTIGVEVPELISLTSPNDPDVKYCNDDPVSLSVETTGDVSVTWQDGAGNILAEGNELTFNPNGDVDIVRAIAVSSDPACGGATLEFNLSQFIFDLTPCEIPAVICPNTDFMLCIVDNSNSDLSYEWLPASAVVSGGNTANATLSLGTNTDVVVRVTNEEFGCTTEEVFSITLPVLDLTVGADPDPDIFLCDEVIIFAEPGDYSSYDWSNGFSGPTQSVIPTETTTYTVTVTDANGCTNSGSVTINVTVPLCNAETIFVPNAFSPNNDGNNDLLRVRSNAVKEMDFYIVDRWGNEVFRTTNQRDGWNGQFGNDGRELSPDVYAWCLEGRCSNGEPIHLVGNVSLLR